MILTEGYWIRTEGDNNRSQEWIAYIIKINKDDGYSVSLVGNHPDTHYKYWVFLEDNKVDEYGLHVGSCYFRQLTEEDALTQAAKWKFGVGL